MKEFQTKSILSIGDVKIEIGLYDTALAREIAEKLPLCTVMESFGGRKYCGVRKGFVSEIGQNRVCYKRATS